MKPPAKKYQKSGFDATKEKGTEELVEFWFIKFQPEKTYMFTGKCLDFGEWKCDEPKILSFTNDPVLNPQKISMQPPRNGS